MLDRMSLPIVLAPLAGGPTTPRLVAAVSAADAFGFLAAGYLRPQAVAEQIAELRSLTARPFGVNVFSPPAAPADPAAYGGYVAEIGRWAAERGLPVGEPRWHDDGYAGKIDLLVADPVAVVSFTFGMPGEAVVQRLHEAGSEVWVTVTSPAEAAIARRRRRRCPGRAGHRGGRPPRLLRRRRRCPGRSAGDAAAAVVREADAAGGSRRHRHRSSVAAALAAGAQAAQLGTAFLLCPEAGTSEPYRRALRRGDAATG